MKSADQVTFSFKGMELGGHTTACAPHLAHFNIRHVKYVCWAPF